MATRAGTLLEKHVESIFSSAGFDTTTNKFSKDYEIDVLAQLGDIEVIAECKQYEKSNLSVRNLIHEWKGKNDSLEADVVVLVIYGQEVNDKEKKLALEKNIQIWDEGDVEKLLNMSDEKAKDFIFENLPLEDEGLGEAYRTEIRKLVWEPYLQGNKHKDDISHEKLLLMVKQRIRRELFQKGSKSKERKNHIQFFEQVKKSGLIRSNIKVKSSHEKFQKIGKQLNTNESPFKKSTEERYYSYLDSVREELEDAKEYYLDSNGKTQVERLIKARLKHLMKYGSGVEFAARKENKPIEASRSNGKVSLDFEIKKAGDLETIRWILTKEGAYKQQDKENGITKDVVSFSYDDIEEATDAIIRILTEYKNYDLTKIRLVDKNHDEISRGQGLFSKLLR